MGVVADQSADYINANELYTSRPAASKHRRSLCSPACTTNVVVWRNHYPQGQHYQDVSAMDPLSITVAVLALLGGCSKTLEMVRRGFGASKVITELCVDVSELGLILEHVAAHCRDRARNEPLPLVYQHLESALRHTTASLKETNEILMDLCSYLPATAAAQTAKLEAGPSTESTTPCRETTPNTSSLTMVASGPNRPFRHIKGKCKVWVAATIKLSKLHRDLQDHRAKLAILFSATNA